MKTIWFTAVGAMLVASVACAPATPTVDPASIQASAVAAASTMVAMTQAAIPSPTEIPPTPPPSPTPLPSPTLIALPTLDLSGGVPAAAPTAAGSTAGSDPCGPNAPYKPLDPGAKGPTAKKVLIQNVSDGDAILSLYLNKTPFGECGGRSFNIGGKGSILILDLKAGCYFGGAFITGKKAHKEFGNFCVSQYADKVSIIVGGGSVHAQPY
jgi:hypothetical protein